MHAQVKTREHKHCEKKKWQKNCKKTALLPQKGRVIVGSPTPSGNRTRVSPVAGAYSTTRPTVLEAVNPPSVRCTPATIRSICIDMFVLEIVQVPLLQRLEELRDLKSLLSKFFPKL